MTPSKPTPCKNCSKTFDQYDDGKGTPQLYCSKQCKGVAKRARNLANRKARGIDTTLDEARFKRSYLMTGE